MGQVEILNIMPYRELSTFRLYKLEINAEIKRKFKAQL